MGAPSQSYVNTASLQHNHVASDYLSPVTMGPGNPGGAGETCKECDSDGDIPTPENSFPPLQIMRQNRGRDMTEISSFGPGWFSSFDMKLHLNSDEVGDIDVFDPADAAPRRFKHIYWGDTEETSGQEFHDGDDGIFEHEANGVIKKLTLMDSSGTPTPTRATAEKAVVENWAGVQFEFEVFLQEEVAGGGSEPGSEGGCGPEPNLNDYPSYDDYYDAYYEWYECEYVGGYSGSGGSGGGSSGGSTDNDLYEARLTKIKNLDGKELNVTYKTFTQAEIDQSPEVQWQIDTVTDALGQVATFTYGATQVGGRWVVTQVDLPDGNSVTYQYGTDKLTGVTRPGGSQSSFTTSFDSNIQHVVTTYDDPAATEAADRDKEVWTTSTFIERPGSNGVESGFYNQSSQIIRAIIDAEDNVGFAQFSEGSATGQQWTYEGGGVLKRQFHDVETRFATGWEIVDDGTGKLIVNAAYEDNYSTSRNTMGNWKDGQPDAIIDETGVRRDFEYDDDGFVSKIIYGDQSFETAEYNSLHQLTRYQDRSNRVTKYTYDALGHRLTKEVGILAVETDPGDPYGYPPTPPTYDDQLQPEHAVYSWEYYPTGHINAGLLKTEFDPLWDGSSADTHRTDYEYNSNGQVTKKLGPASITGGDRPEYNYTYNASGLLVSMVNPAGHTTSYTYDSEYRLVRTTYDDSSTMEVLYGAPGTVGEGLPVKRKDRRNVVTEMTYDNVGRVTQAVVATAWDADILDGNPDDTPITDRNEKSITAYEYDVGVLQPVKVIRDGSRTDFEYDYRQRAIATTVYPYANKTLTSKVAYEKNRKFLDEDPYGRKTFYGYRASDGAMVRVVKGAYPSFSLSNNSSVLSIGRDTNLNPTHTVKDMIQDLSGNQIQVVDERGIQHSTDFDSRGHSIRDTKAVGTPVEAITETDYDVAGNAVEIRSPRYFDPNDTNGFQKCKTVMMYDGAGRVLTRTEAPGTPEAGTESYAYDTSSRQISRTDARGKIWTTTYASCCGHSVASINPLGHGSVTNQNDGGLVVHTAGIADVATHTSLLDPDNAKTLRETTTRYDALGRSIANCTWLVPQGLIDASNPPMAGFDGISGDDGLATQTLYDADLTDGVGLDSSAGVTVTNPLGGTYTVSLSAALTKMAEATTQGGAGLTFDASSSGSAVVNLNAENEVSFSISDAAGRTIISGILHPHDALNGATPGDLITWSCQVHDTVETIGSDTFLTSIKVDALGHTTKARSNGLGHTQQSVDQEGFISTVQYDAGGNAVISRDPNNVGYDAVYDALGRPTSRTDTVGSVTQSVYNKAGQQIQAIDAKNKPTNYVFNARGQRTAEVDRLGYTTNWSYDLAGNLLTLTDAENQVTSYTYNDAGQRITEQYPDHIAGSVIGDNGYGIITFTYDALGRRTVKEDQQGDTTSYNFDLSGRLLTRVYVGHATSPLAGQTDTDTFTYDRNGRMLSGIKGRYNNTVTFSYDDRGQQVQETLTTHGQTYTVGYEKNDLGQTTQLQYPDSSLVDRTYTDRGQLLTVKYRPSGGTQSDVADFVYDAGGRETNRNLGNGLTTSRSYFADNQIQNIATPSVESLTYTYDVNKNPTSETRSGVMAPYSWSTGPSGFDDDNRLINWSRNNGDTQTWNLSPVNDWVSTSFNGVPQTRTHGPAHEVLTVTGAEVPNGTATLQHDCQGNMTTDERGCILVYDFDNMVQEFEANGVTDLKGAAYTYDAIGRRVSKAVMQPNSHVETTIFAHAGQQVVCEYLTTDPTTNCERKFAYGNYIDEPLLFVDSTANTDVAHYLLRNRQYSVYASTTQNAEVKERYSYSPTGSREVVDAGALPVPPGMQLKCGYGFSARRYDTESGFLYFRARMYSPRIGQFLSMDPSLYAGSPYNLFAFLQGNPVASVDPLGLELLPPPTQCVKTSVKVVRLCRAVQAGMIADTCVPEPTDAAPPKWVCYAVLTVVTEVVICSIHHEEPVGNPLPEPNPNPAPENGPVPPKPKHNGKNCWTNFPHLPRCTAFQYASQNDAVFDGFDNDVFVDPETEFNPSHKNYCKGGSHSEYYWNGGGFTDDNYAGSVTCCPCCKEDKTGARESTGCHVRYGENITGGY